MCACCSNSFTGRFSEWLQDYAGSMMCASDSESAAAFSCLDCKVSYLYEAGYCRRSSESLHLGF